MQDLLSLEMESIANCSPQSRSLAYGSETTSRTTVIETIMYVLTIMSFLWQWCM